MHKQSPPSKDATDFRTNDRAAVIQTGNDGSRAAIRWWQEWEVGLLVLLVALLFLPRLALLNVRGEEPRRAQVAVEMIDSGDWIVPHQQGQLYFSRPPLQNWTIGLLGLLRGEVDRWAIRLPSVIAVLGVVLLIYAYARSFLSPTGSLVAGVAFASMAQVLELGRLGETDMLFTLFVSASLLLWHYGRRQGWPTVLSWTVAYAMVALGTLTKGPQAPFYFVVTVGIYLLLTRRWRDALSWAHLAGIGVFLLIWGTWQMPYFRAVGLDGTMRIYGRNVAVRFDDTSCMDYVGHFFTYPLEILCGCLLPWSFMLLAFASRDFRRRIQAAKDHVLFLVVAIAVALSTLWFVPTARSRYFMPLYPCFALLIGLVAQRCWQADKTARWWRRIWSHYLIATALVMLAAGLAVLTGTFILGGQSLLSQPSAFALVYALAVVVLATAAFWAALSANHRHRLVGTMSVALFMGITFVGAFSNSLLRRSVDQQAMVAELKEKIPRDARLVSFGIVHHLFAYHYGELIEPIRLPQPGQAPPEGVEYFCFHSRQLTADDVPFAFETLAVIPCDRFAKPQSSDYVTVARRLTNRPPAGNGSMASRAAPPVQSR